jgi:multidrug efflux pump subunit AcrA (membrane-fusion protein)
MTFVGKILVIVIMAFALMFLGISTVVFTTATNWRKATEDQKKKVSELTQKNSTATAEITTLKKDLTKAQGDAAAVKQTLDNTIAKLNGDIERMQKETTEARSELVVAQQSAKTALDDADARRKEAELLREQKLAVEKQANDYKLRQAELNDQIRILTRERDVAKKNADDLRNRSAKLSSLLRKHGLSDDISQVTGLESPPAVHGEVARVEANRRVELTIGSDDGLVVGHELSIFRLKPRPEYLGKIRIISVDPDQAVGVVIGNTYQGKKIREGDIVSSTFRNVPRS